MVSKDNSMKWEDIVNDTVKFISDKSNIGPKKLSHFKEWLSSKSMIGRRVDNILVHRCYKIAKSLNQTDSDHVMAIDGLEGKGKTTLAIDCCCFVDPTFDIDRICFNSNQFYNTVKIAKRGQAVLLDEGALNLMSRDAMKKSNKGIVKLFTFIRKKGLFLVICIPNMFILDTYIREHRAKTILRIEDFADYRGLIGDAIEIWNSEGSRKLKVRNRKIKLPRGHYWDGDWNKEWPKMIDKKAYELKKDEFLNEVLDALIQESDSSQSKEEDGVKFIPSSTAAKKLGISAKRMRRLIRESDELIEKKKINHRWFITHDSLNKLLSIEGE